MTKRIKMQIARTMVLFAKKNQFTIHPFLGCEYFIKNFQTLNSCACAPERKCCPCPESIQEVSQQGKCKCGLYWKSLECWMRYDPVNPGKDIMQEAKIGDQHS